MHSMRNILDWAGVVTGGMFRNAHRKMKGHRDTSNDQEVHKYIIKTS